jgi:hypothetical protein
MLYGVKPLDPLTLGASALVLGSVALVATLVPARRAARSTRSTRFGRNKRAEGSGVGLGRKRTSPREGNQEVSSMQRLFNLRGRVPAWLRPTYQGAILPLRLGLGWGGKLLVAALLGMLMLLLGGERGLVLFGELTLVAIAAGAVAGTLHGMLRPVQRWGGPLGTWLQWAVTCFGYVVALVFLTPNSPFFWRDPTFLPLEAGFAALGGLCMVLLDDRSLDRPSEREYQIQQSRKQLWTTARYRRSRLQLERGTVRP